MGVAHLGEATGLVVLSALFSSPSPVSALPVASCACRYRCRLDGRCQQCRQIRKAARRTKANTPAVTMPAMAPLPRPAEGLVLPGVLVVLVVLVVVVVVLLVLLVLLVMLVMLAVLALLLVMPMADDVAEGATTVEDTDVLPVFEVAVAVAVDVAVMMAVEVEVEDAVLADALPELSGQPSV